MIIQNETSCDVYSYVARWNYIQSDEPFSIFVGSPVCVKDINLHRFLDGREHALDPRNHSLCIWRLFVVGMWNYDSDRSDTRCNRGVPDATIDMDRTKRLDDSHDTSSFYRFDND